MEKLAALESSKSSDLEKKEGRIDDLLRVRQSLHSLKKKSEISPAEKHSFSSSSFFFKSLFLRLFCLYLDRTVKGDRKCGGERMVVGSGNDHRLLAPQALFVFFETRRPGFQNWRRLMSDVFY